MLQVIVVTLLVMLYWLWQQSKIAKDAPYVPLDPNVVDRIMKIAEVGPNDRFYDLGSGDGRVVVAAALHGARSTGIEIDPLRALWSRFYIWLFRLRKKADIITGDIFKHNFSDATVVCTYLLPETNDKLQSKLEKELKPGTRVVGVAFKYKDWKIKKIDPHGPIYGPIYLYKI